MLVKIIVGIVLFFLAAIGFVAWRAEQIHEEGRQRVEGLLQEIRAAERTRPPLFGEGEAGDAWELYRIVGKTVKDLPEKDLDVLYGADSFIEGGVDLIRLEELYRKAAPSINLIRQALGTTGLDHRFLYEKGVFDVEADSLSFIRMSRMLSAFAEHLHRKGRDRDALELLVMVMGMAHDSVRAAPMGSKLISGVCEDVALNKWKVILENHDLSVESAREICSWMDRLQAGRPSGLDSWRAEEMVLYSRLVSKDPAQRQSIFRGAKEPGWRQLYSKSVCSADAIQSLPEFFAMVRRVHEREYSERQRAMEQFLSSWKELRNPYLAHQVEFSPLCFRRDAEVRLRIRLARIAMANLLYELENGRFAEAIEDLVPAYLSEIPRCPMSGMPYRVSGSKVWSFGPDGDDDGGEPVEDEGYLRDFSEGDVVWTVRRKPPDSGQHVPDPDAKVGEER